MTGLDLSAFDQIRLYTGANSTFAVDEVRLATSFETAIPEPATYACALGAASIALVFARRRRRHA